MSDVIDQARPRYASPADVATYGEYRYVASAGDARPLYRFAGRVTADGSSGYRAESGRYHLYVGWFCPWSQRSTIQRLLNGLADVVSVSYVDDARDGRGWAFRDHHGPDPVNRFTLLRQAFEATEPGYDGVVSVPLLWDRTTSRIVSNDYATIDLDLATQFGRWGNGSDTYPESLRAEIDQLEQWLGPAVNHGVTTGAGSGPYAGDARVRLLAAFADLDARLATRRYLLGDQLTAADVRLWVSLVRYDAGPNATRAFNLGLAEYSHLWAYARDLYRRPAFRDTTRFASFTAAGASVPDWDVASGDVVD